MPRQSATIPDSKEDLNANKTIDELRREALGGVLQISQFACLAFGNFADAGAVGVFGPPMAEEVVVLAKDNSKVAEKVDLLIQVGPYAGLVAAIITLSAQLMVNHKMFKAEVFANAGVLPPEILETQMKTQILQKAAEAKQEQMEAAKRLRDMEEEMLRNMNGDAESQEREDPTNV